MKVVVAFAKLALLPIVLLAIMAQACDSLENPTTQFENKAELESSGYLQKGWLPRALPPSATDIRETHNLDSNRMSGTFRYTPGDTETTRLGCQQIGEPSEDLKFICPTNDGLSATVVLMKDGTGHIASR